MRHSLLALAIAAGVVSASPPVRAESDFPYYKLNYANYDTTYEAVDAKARRYAFFYWDGQPYCRYRTGWNGPGAYHVGTRLKRGYGWDGGYPWQGPGVPADHEDDEAYAQAKTDYAREFRRSAVCGVVHRHRRVRHRVVLRRKD